MASPVSPRIGRLVLAVVAVGALASFACSHPTGSGSTPGTGGSTGSPGAAGSGGPGTAGNVGSPGAGGNVGSPGSGGDVGSPGSGGNVSTPGTAGDSGTAGVSGAAGDTGTPGTAGATGTAGSGGNAGTTGGGGNAGNTGSGGTTGSAGTTGGGGSTGSGGSSPAGNLIVNGDFSNGAENWHTEMGNGAVNGTGAYCVTNPGSALIGWNGTPGSLLMLRQGTSYRLSYQASGSGTVNAKVALAVQPYTADFEGSNSINSSLQTFTHTFTSPNNDPNTGLAFTFSGAGSSTVCIDNVSLVAN